MDAIQREYRDGRDAVLFGFGNELVVGAVAETDHFAVRQYLGAAVTKHAAVRNGHGDALVVAGVYSPSENAFIAVPTEQGLTKPVQEVASMGIPIL
jgi:hypothetical protein